MIVIGALTGHLPKMQEAILSQHKAEVEARGEIWISPVELTRQEKAENEQLSDKACYCILRTDSAGKARVVIK